MVDTPHTLDSMHGQRSLLRHQMCGAAVHLDTYKTPKVLLLINNEPGADTRYENLYKR